jgi:hypothetical protein
MAKKTYLLTVEYDSDTDTVEYLQEEVISEDGDKPQVIEELDLELKFDKKMLDLMRKHYIVGES